MGSYAPGTRGTTRERFPGPLTCPPKDEHSRIIAFLDTICDHETPGRRELETEFVESKAFVEGHHWLDNPSGKPWGQAREFREMDQSLESMPLTVTNETYAMVDTERSRLGKRRSQPYVRPRRGEQGSAKVAAAKADDIVDSDMDRMRWASKYRDWVTDTVMFGTGVTILENAHDYRRSTKAGLPGTQKCHACRFTAASKEIPPEAVSSLGADKLLRLKPVDKVGPGTYSRGYELGGQCLACGDAMEPWAMTDEDLQGKDFFGRALARDIPYGDTMLRNRSPWELFVENEGIGLRPGPMGEPGHPNWYCEDYAAPIEEVASYYEKGEGLQPDNPIDLARQFPMLGVYSNAGFGWRGVTDRTVYHNHIRMRRFIQGPTRHYPLGRMLDVAGNGSAGTTSTNSILVDTELFVRSKDDKDLLVPRRSIHSWRFFPKMNEWWGQGLPVPLMSPQRRIDMTFSQVVWNRETNGNNGLLITPGMRVTNPGHNTRLPGNYSVWYPDPRHPGERPEQIQGRLMDPNVWQEVDYTIKRMQYIAGIMDVDVGQPTGGVTAAIAIEMLASKSSERRDMREQEGVDACKDIFRHTLMMKREFLDEGESRSYMAKGTGDVWVKRQFKAADLKGQTDMVVDEEPSHDVKAYSKQIIIEGLDRQVVPIDTAYSRREVRRELGIRSDIAQGEDVQVNAAERKWHEFEVSLDEAQTKGAGALQPGQEPTEVKIPSIAPTQDDHATHFQVFGQQWMSEEGVEILERADWKRVAPLLAGWRKDYDQQVAKRAAFDQVLLSGQLEQARSAVEASNQQVQQAQEQGVQPGVIAAAGVMADPMQVQMVQEFAEYVPPPEATELHIEAIWLERLAEDPTFFEAPDPALMPPPSLDPMAPPPEMPAPEVVSPLKWVLKMQAVTEAHFLLDQQQKQAAMQGMAVPAAPSAATQTAAGTVASPGQGVTQ